MQLLEMSESDKIKILERCLDDGARQVEGLNEFATSGDQRAMALGGTFLSAATAVAAVLIAWAGQDRASLPHEVLIPGVVAAAMFYAGGAVCIWTASPAPTFIAGNPPKFWKYTLENDYTYEEALLAQVEEYQSKIAMNAKSKKRNAWIYKMGAFCGALAPLVAVAIYLL